MSTKLNPQVVSNETEALDAAFDGIRRRPIVAITDEGELVVCCRHTAKKHGWAIQGKLFARTRTGKKAQAAKLEELL